MLEEDEDSHLTGTEQKVGEMCDGDEMGKDFGGPAILTLPTNMAALDVSDSFQQTPKYLGLHGQPKNVSDNNEQHLVTEELNIENMSCTNSTGLQQTDSEMCSVNGSSFGKCMKGICDQEHTLTLSCVHKKDNETTDSFFDLASEQPETTKSRQTGVSVQDNSPPPLSDMYQSPISDIEDQNEFRLEEGKSKDSNPGKECAFFQERGKNEAYLSFNHDDFVCGSKHWTKMGKGNVQDIQAATSSTQVTTNMCLLGSNPELNEPSKNVSLTNQKESQSVTTAAKDGEKAGVLCLPYDLKSFNSDVTSFPLEGEEIIQPVEKMIESSGRGTSPKPEVTHRRKAGRPRKKRRVIKTQIGQKADCPHLDSMHCVEENHDSKTVSDVFDVSQNGELLDIIEKEAHLVPKSSKGLTVLGLDDCKTSLSKTTTEFTPIITGNIKPPKKVGRPRKKCTNTRTQPTSIVGGNIYIEKSRKESLQDISGKNIFDETSRPAKKRTAGKWRMQDSVSDMLTQKVTVNKLVNNNTIHTKTVGRKPGQIQPVCSIYRGIKERKVVNPNGPLSKKSQKRCHQNFTLPEAEKGNEVVQTLSLSPKNCVDQESHSACNSSSDVVHVNKLTSVPDEGSKTADKSQSPSNNVVIPQYCEVLSELGGSCQETEGCMKNTVKAVKTNTLRQEAARAKESLSGFKASEDVLNFKRKIGRPLKKKTLIKMAKQLILAQESKVNNVIGNSGTHNTTCVTASLHSKKNKKDKKEADLPKAHLRRYARACKVVTNCTKTVKKDSRSKHTNKSTYLNNLVTSKSKTKILTKDTSKLGGSITAEHGDAQLSNTKSLKKKGRCVQVRVQSEDSQQSLSDFSLKNSNTNKRYQQMVSHDSVLSTGENPSNICDKKKRATKLKQIIIKRGSGKSFNTDNILQIQDNLMALPKILPLPKHNPGDITCNPDKAGKARSSETIEAGDNVLKLKGLGKKVCVSTPHLALSSMPALHQIDVPNKCLLSSQDTATSTDISSVKVPRKRGRPRKNDTILNHESVNEVKTPCPIKSVVHQNTNLSKECNSGSLETEVSYLNFSNIKTKKPHKIDRRRKRFRMQKALAGMDDTVSQTVGVIADEVTTISQKHCMKLQVDTPLQQNPEGTNSNENDSPVCSVETGLVSSNQKHMKIYNSDRSTKQSRKGVGLWKRRRRKRSWWDDRGKAKSKTSGKKLDEPLQSAEDNTRTETFQKSLPDERNTTELVNEAVDIAQATLQKATAQNPSLTGQTRSDEEIVIEPSDGKNIITEEQTDGKEVGPEDHESLKIIACLDIPAENQFTDGSISENTIQPSAFEDEGNSLEIEPNVATASCNSEEDKRSVEEITEKTLSELQKGTETSESEAVEAMTCKDNLEPPELISDFPKENTEHVSKRDQLRPNEEAEQQEKDGTFRSAEANQSLDIDHLASKEFEVQAAVNPEFPGSTEGKSNSCENPPAAKAESRYIFLQPKCIQNDSAGEDNVNGIGQDDKDKCGGSNVESDCSKNLSEEAPLTLQSSKPYRHLSKFQVKKPVECHYCGRCFHHISSYIIHRRIHTGEKPYSCQECGKAFAQRSNLNAHRKVHTTKAPEHMQCPYCMNRSSDKDELCQHCQIPKEDPTPISLIRKTSNDETNIEISPKNDTACSTISMKDVKLHVCEVCGKGFCFSSKLKIHLRVHSGEKPYSCKVCDKTFSQASTLRVHEKIHWSIKPYVCSVCGKGFSQLGTLKTHLWRHMGESHVQEAEKVNSSVTFQCHICKKNFGLRHQYNLHIRTHANFQLYICDVCGRKYTQISELNSHRESCFNLNGKQVDKQSNQDVQLHEIPDVEFRSFQHDQLPIPWPHSQGFQKNLLGNSIDLQAQTNEPSHKKNKPHLSQTSSRPKDSLITDSHISNIKYLPQCHFTKHYLFQLQHVHRKSDPRKYLCPRCSRLFRHLGRLRAHMLTHIRGQNYSCSCCGKVLENWSKFRMHQRVHRQKRGRFFCPKCGQGFRFVGLYKQHLQKHTEQKLYARSVCPNTFSHEGGLRDHQRRLHKSEKKYKCNACVKGFFYQRNLKRHIITHHQAPSHNCVFCNLSFLHVSELKLHLKTHVNLNVSEGSSQPALPPYQCGRCDASFKTLNLLLRHKLCHSSPAKQKAWQRVEAVGQQQQFNVSYRFKDTLANFVQPEISSLKSCEKRGGNVYACADTMACSNVSRVYEQNSALMSSFPVTYQKPPHLLPFISQQEEKQHGHTHSLQPLANDTCLPQTLSSTAVPFPERQPQQFRPHTQKGISVPSSPHKQSHSVSQDQRRQDPQTDQTHHIQNPPLTQETMRGDGKASSPSVRENEEDVEESFDCTECNAQFDDVPKLYEHYLQHARGEV